MATSGKVSTRKGKKAKTAPEVTPSATAKPLTSNVEPFIKTFYPKTESQNLYYNSIFNNVLTFGVGPSGVGKTRVVARCIVEMLVTDKVERAIISRPCQEAGEKLGAIPGGLKEKIEPYMAPLMTEIYAELGSFRTDIFLRQGRIRVLPLAFTRGWNFNNTIAVLDEAQNTSKTQMQMFLTRIGENCHMVIDGDSSQLDISKNQSGLEDAIQRMTGDPETGIIRFTPADIVRHGIVRRVVENYAKEL